MKKNLFTICLLTVVLFQACQSDDISNSNTTEESKVLLNSNSTELSNRMDHSNSGVITLKTSKLTSRNAASQGADNFPMSLLAEVNPPIYEGKKLTATHVDVKDNYVYVSYNTQGETYLGGIDVIDVSQPNNPKLVVQAILPNTDISTVLYNNGTLFISGASSRDANPELTSSAFVAKMPLQNGLLTNNYSPISLNGNVGTGVVAANSNYFAISGNNGVLAKISNTSNIINTAIPVADLRALGYIDNKVVVLSGTEGVKIYNADSMTLISSIKTSSDVPDAKRTIDFQGTNLLVADGYSGLKVFSSTGSLLQTFGLPTGIPDVNQEDIVTNAVSVNGDYVYSANGGAGIAVYKNTNNSLTSIGSIFLGGSANYVKSAGDYIFVATGTGGLKIIKKLSASIDCTSFPTYKGGDWLNVNSGDNFSYQGSASLQGINVNQNLTFCGSLSVAQGLNINSGGIFTMKGSMAQGNYNNPYLSFNVNGTLKIDGSVVIYGNLILNSGARVQFSSGSSITIYGNVTKNSGVTITGEFTDSMNKLK
ncbi:LVIVD repeat-containing protein [Flavobacterium aquicola]|uniref:LVIVD repeat-containing protein n=1 Tax=Flavobacterium aquicola TaxID=1682742 RepID=A0A3E0EVD0_9FLAO|nr:hypothetical protein [Flavobacterium aquicola]REH01077.1 hypothetical protein C8P67_102335 [Flavobacterium aquicola]